jgi:hypothetical protein
MELKPVLSIAVKQGAHWNLKNNKVKMVYVAPESLSYLENAFKSP